MKNRILSLLLVITTVIPLCMLPVSADDGSISKNLMLQYITYLTDEEIGHYTDTPFGEYNENLSNIVSTIDYDIVEMKFTVDDFGWDTFIKDYQEIMLGKEVYDAEQYQALFSDMIIRLGELAEKERDFEFEKDRINEIKTAISTASKVDNLFKNDYVLDAYFTMCEKDHKKLFRMAVGNLPSSVQSDLTFNKNLADLEIKLIDYLAILFRDYEIYADYLEKMKEIVYDFAESSPNKAQADAMKNAFDKVYLSYHSKSSGAIFKFMSDFFDNLENEFIKQAQSVIIIGVDDLIKNINLGQLAGKAVAAIDLAITVKDICSELSGLKTAVASAKKLQFANAFNYIYQYKFLSESKKVLSDGLFTDDEYKEMKLLFSICRANQALSYSYANKLNADDFWYHAHTAANLSNETYGYNAELFSDSEIISRYIKYAEMEKPRNIVDSGQCGDTLYWEMTDDGELIIFGDGEMYHSEYSYGFTLISGFPVDKKHWDNTKVTHVSFEGNVTSIGNGAFSGNVTSNVMDGSVTDSRCTNLTFIELPETLHTIGSHAFSQCINLEKVVFPNSLKNISYSAFSGCSKLNADNIPSSVKNIGQNAFTGCLRGEFVIPEGITTLTSGMIADPNLTELTIPENITTIEANFFQGFPALETVYMLTKHPLTAYIGVNEMVAGYDFTVYGYDNAKDWVDHMNNPYLDNDAGLGKYMPQSNFINFISLEEKPKIPEDQKGETSLEVAKDAVKVTVNGKQVEFDVQPQIINDRTMVPVRAVVEALGNQVEWDQTKQEVFIYGRNVQNGDYRNCYIIIGADSFFWENSDAMVNGGPNGRVTLDSPAVIIDSRTLLPIRAVAEIYGYQVDWDNDTRTVIINSESTASNTEGSNDTAASDMESPDVILFDCETDSIINSDGTTTVKIIAKGSDNVGIKFMGLIKDGKVEDIVYDTDILEVSICINLSELNDNEIGVYLEDYSGNSMSFYPPVSSFIQ